MRKGLHKKALAGLLAFAVVASGSGIYSVANGISASAADTDNTPLTDVLGADDLSDLRYTWEDESNVGTEREVALSDGTKIKVKDNGTMRTELTSQQLADSYMGTGANLGNTLEAVQLIEYKNTVTGTGFDTAWSNKPATQAYIDSLHSYGINTLRIPVAWSNGDIDDGNYNIRPALLDRIETVVNYALNDGMYVIINDHWDNQWWGQFGACKKDAAGNKVVDQETRDNAWKRYEKYWTQIAERFKDYSDHLIFEGANEELGTRLNDAIVLEGPYKGYVLPTNASSKEHPTLAGNLNTNELYSTVNEINQTFVNIIRKSGGNNVSRHLLIPGYDTNIQSTADSRFAMPTDTTANGKSKLFLSVHYYTPTGFCLDGATGTYTKGDQAKMPTYLADLKKFSDAGYGIIMGECGVVNPSGVAGSVTQWMYDTFKEMKKYHTVPVLWETGQYFDRGGTTGCYYNDIATFYNTVNGANGSTDAERVTGGAPPEGGIVDIEVPDYLDEAVWKTMGLHAYLYFQMPTWDFRNQFVPVRNLGYGEQSWEYIKATGVEVNAEDTKVTDVLLTKDGEYTVAIEGIDLSGANNFCMLGVATDINTKTYPNVKVTNATLKIDGENVLDSPVELPCKGDDNYLTFVAINTYNSGRTAPFDELNDDEDMPLPSQSIEITFTISGLDKPLADIASGAYIDPQTGKRLDGKEDNTENNGGGAIATNPPSSTPTPAPLKKGATFTSGNYKYKVTKAATAKTKGTVTMTGLAAKGKSAKKLSVAATAKDTNGSSYTVNAIGKKAFSGAKATSVTLNKNIKKIPSSAFAKCKKLNTLTLKAKLKTVSKNAFKGCKKKIKVKGTGRKANLKKLKKTSYKKFK